MELWLRRRGEKSESERDEEDEIEEKYQRNRVVSEEIEKTSWKDER